MKSVDAFLAFFVGQQDAKGGGRETRINKYIINVLGRRTVSGQGCSVAFPVKAPRMERRSIEKIPESMLPVNVLLFVRGYDERRATA